MLTFRVLGAVGVCGTDGRLYEVPTVKQRTLLTALLLRPNEWVATSRLIDSLWGEEPPKSAVGNLKTYVWRLRMLLTELTGSERVQSRPGGYRLRLVDRELDALVFEELTFLGQCAVDEGRYELAAQVLQEALQLWRGEPFDGVPGSVVDMQAVRLRESYHSAQEQLVQSQLALGRVDHVLPLLRTMLAEQPLRERSWAQFIAALVGAGRRAEAVVAYQDVYRLLKRELGLEPGPAIKEAYRLALIG